MFCGKCGRELRDGAAFCGACGEPVRQGSPMRQGGAVRQGTPVRQGGPVNQGGVARPVPPFQGRSPQPQRAAEPQKSPQLQRAAEPQNPFAARMVAKRQSLVLPNVLQDKSIVWGVAALLAFVAIAALLALLPESVRSLGSSVILLMMLALLIYCAVKENSTTGLYKTFGVYGRVRAYLFANGFIGGAVSVFMLLASPFAGTETPTAQTFIAMILAIIFVLVMAVIIYLRAYSRCPEMLRPRLFVSMMMSGLGVTCKLTVIFLSLFFGFLWRLEGPREMVDEDGRTVYVHQGDVYDGNGYKVGYVNPYDDSKYVRTV